jgi:aspartate carbamoyltransferase catalytic subunit
MPKSLISIHDFTKEEMLHILDVAQEFEKNKVQRLLQDKVIATLFFEPSTRTRLSFETASNRLGARVIGFSDAGNTSVSKGETLKDTIKMVSNYVDLIVMRHPLEGAARYASEVASVPVINAGDGANQHPSQTMLDLYTIRQTQGKLTDIKLNMVGDLKYGRTVHSLLQAMSHFNPHFTFTAPDELKMPQEYKDFLNAKGIPYTETRELEGNINDCDILYMTRVQQERFTDPMEYEKVKNTYNLTASMLKGAKDNMKILHPLPRITEIAQDVDDTKHAYYFKQAENGVYVRMAIIAYLLGYK